MVCLTQVREVVTVLGGRVNADAVNTVWETMLTTTWDRPLVCTCRLLTCPYPTLCGSRPAAFLGGDVLPEFNLAEYVNQFGRDAPLTVTFALLEQFVLGDVVFVGERDFQNLAPFLSFHASEGNVRN